MARRELRWRRFGEPFSELDMVEAELRGGGSRFDDHFWGHVDPDDPSARTDLGCHHERVEPGPGSDINHPFAWLEPTPRERVADTGEGFDCPVRESLVDLRVIAEASSQGAAAVEVAAPWGSMATSRYFSRTWLRRVSTSTMSSFDIGHPPAPAAIGMPARFHSG